MYKKIFLLFISLMFLHSCWKSIEQVKTKTSYDINVTRFNNQERTWDNINIIDKISNNDVEIKNNNFLKQQKLVEEMKKEIEKKEEKTEEMIEKLNLDYCDKYISKESKDECKLKIIFSKSNTEWCNLIKWKDKVLYKKCLEIKEWIEEYKKIRTLKYYYDTYGSQDY